MQNPNETSHNLWLIEEVISTVVKEKTVEEKLYSILRLIHHQFQCQSCAIVMYNEDTNQFQLKGFMGMSHSYEKKFEEEYDPTLLKTILETENVIQLPAEGEFSQLNEIKFEHSYQSMLIKSLKMANTTFGFCFMSSEQADFFSGEDVRLFKMLSELASVSLYNLYLRDSFQSAIKDYLLIDKETGLYNIKVFRRVINRELERARHFDHDLSLMLIDIDHKREFIAINGEEMGKRMVRDVGNLIRSRIRSFDVACLYHDYIVVICPELNLDGVINVAETIQNTIRNHQFESPTPKIRLSIAVAEYPEDGTSERQIMTLLQKAIYNAKRDKGDTIKTVIKE